MRKCKRVSVGIVGLVLTATLVQASLAFPSGQPVTDYEISLHELSKVKKELPAKRKLKDRRKRKKTDAIQLKAAPDAAMPQESDSRINPPSNKSNMPATPELQQPRLRNESERTPENRTPALEAPAVEPQAALVEKPRISHDPYSYLVAGKQTVILAVINSAADIKAVYCKFRGEEKGEDSIAPMTKVDGTQYTYRAILPGLAPSARSLRYRLVVVDTLGRETQSREFFTSVKSSPVIPGWQLEDSPTVLTVDHPVSGKPLESSPAPLSTK